MSGEDRRPLQKAACGLQFLAQLLHLGARLRVFGTHVVDERPQLAHLLLQIVHRVQGAVIVRWGGTGRRLLLCHQKSGAENENRCGEDRSTNRRSP